MMPWQDTLPPGRGPRGYLRNFRAMADYKLARTYGRLLMQEGTHRPDSEALRRCQAIARARGLEAATSGPIPYRRLA